MTKSLPPTSRSLPFALIRAREGVMAPIREMLTDTGMTEQQWRVLRVLAEFGAQDSSTLADRAAILHPSLTRMVFSMAQKGLVTQDRSDKDRRRQVIRITDEGQAIIDKNLPQAKRIVAGFKARVGEEKYEQLLDLLEVFYPGNAD